MSRRVLVVVLVAVAVVSGGFALLSSGSSGGDDDYRVAAVFDTAKGMVAGQQVKIAGAVVGRIEEIDLAPGPKARMELRVERRFSPFRADASCSIRPEGLISENFVECDPGSAGGALTTDAGGTPTVPLERTSVPVSLQDVIDVFSLPTAERLRVFITELGIAGSGRGQDINALLRRANPALASSERVLSILEAQRDQLSASVEQTDRVLDRLAADDQQVRTFVSRAADVVETTAARRANLQQSIAELPPMLRAVRPGLRAVDRAALSATPLLRSLRRSAPGLERLTTTLPAFARAGRPALASLRAVSATARPALRSARPVVRQLRRTTGRLAPLTPEVDKLLVSLRDTGGIEGTMRIAYTLAILASSYDETSHLINFIANVAPVCIAAELVNTDAAGCSRMWRAPGDGTVPINNPACGAQAPENVWRNHTCDLPTPPVGQLPALPPSTTKTPAKRPSATAPARPEPTATPKPGATPANPLVPLPLPLDVPQVLEDLLGGLGLGGKDGAPGLLGVLGR